MNSAYTPPKTTSRPAPTKPRKMKPSFKKAFVAELRTSPDKGGHVQGDGRLYVEGVEGGEDRFCCLGVACNMLVREGILDWEKKYVGVSSADRQNGSAIELQEMYLLPKKAATYIGMDEETMDYLSGLNDEGYTFSAIANYVENCL